MVRCSFCGNTLIDGKGKMYVKNTGQIFHFCKSKCQKNWNLGRVGKNVAWTETYKKEKGKEKK